MNNTIKARLHHMMCFLDYQGVGYSQKHSQHLNRVTTALKKYPNIKVKIVEGEDIFCHNCPNNNENGAACNSEKLLNLDKKIEQITKLKTNTVLKYQEIIEVFRNKFDKTKHKIVCGDCQWRTFGFCEDTFKKA